MLQWTEKRVSEKRDDRLRGSGIIQRLAIAMARVH